MHQAERLDRSAGQITKPPDHVYEAAYSGDLSLSHGGPRANAGDHGFPSTSDALAALGLGSHGDAPNRARDTGTMLTAAEKTNSRRMAKSGIDRDRDPSISDSVSDEQADAWGAKFDMVVNKPGATPSSVMRDLEKEAAKAGTNPDGSPKVSITAVRDEYGKRHYYAMFNKNAEQARLNQEAVRQGKVNLAGRNGMKAAIAEIGWTERGDGELI